MARDPYVFAQRTGRVKYWKTQEKELQTLMGPETGELKPELARYVKCVVCTSKDHNLVFLKEGFRFVKCCRCGLLFVNPQLDESRLVSSYKEDLSHEKWVDILLSSAQQAYDSRYRFGEALRRLERCYPHKGRGKILDIGCSIGLFLKLARDRGWQPYGLEINKKALKHATEVFGLHVEPKLLHEVDYPESYFQIISLWGVLEHTPNPDEILRQVRPLLHPKGTLVILVPNVHSLATRVMHEHSPTFGGRNHLWYFSPETLSRLLRRQGYKVTDLYTQLDQYEELIHYLRFNHPYIPAKKILHEEFHPSPHLRAQMRRFIEENHLGYKLIVFASKKGA